MKNQIEIYTTKDNETAVEVRFDQETVWLSQDQLTMLFQRDQSVISRHINNVFKEGELEQKSNMQKMHIANSDKPVAFYNLDVIISVGYRVKSKRGTQFRQWATQRLKDYLVQGYAAPLLMATSALPPRVSCFSCNETTVCALPERAWPSAMKRWPV